MRKLRLGVAGLGFGAAVHVPAFRALPGVEVVAIAGSSLKRTRPVAERLGIAYSCEGIVGLLQQDIDIVTLALPPTTQGEALDQVLARALDVLVEKPIAADARFAAQLAARGKGRITGVNFIFAELTTFKVLRRLVEEGALGDICEVALDWQVRSYAHQNCIWSWKTDAARAGGVMTALGAHALYLVEWLFGPVRLASASLDNGATATFAPPGEKAAADIAHVILTLANGASAGLAMRNSGGGPLHRWTVRGVRGAAVLENTASDYVAGFRLLLNGVEIARERFAGGDSRLEAFAPLASRFLTAVRSRLHITPSLDAGARVQALIAEIEAVA